MAAEADLGLVGLEGRSAPIGHLFDSKGYQLALERDLADGAKRVVLASSWARFSRVKALGEALGGALARGVVADVVLREPKRASAEWQQVLAALRELGCRVQVVAGDRPLDLVVIDAAIVWFGGAAPLAYARRDDRALRIVSREVAVELLEVLGIR